MKNKNKFLILSIINSILILSCIVGFTSNILNQSNIYYVISSMFFLIPLIFSILYYLSGYQKDASKFFKFYMLFYSFTFIVHTITMELSFPFSTIMNILFILFSFLLYGNTLLLAKGENLGKKLSLSLCFFGILIHILFLVFFVLNTNDLISSLILYISWLFLSVNQLIMIIAKYTDKSIRGTK